MSEPKFKHLLEPLKIGNYVLKNRMCVSNSLPHFLQGPRPILPIRSWRITRIRPRVLLSLPAWASTTLPMASSSP